MRILGLLLLISCMLLCCKKTVDTNKIISREKDHITVNIDKAIFKNIDYSDLFDSYNLIPLETAEHCLISQIKRLEIFNDSIYVFDEKAGSVLVFDIDGRFISRIGRKGRGRGEYIKLKCFTLNRDREEILCLDSKQRKIIVYTLQGKLKKEIRFPHSHLYNNMCALGSNIYLDAHIFSGRPKTKSILYCLDYDGKVIWEWCPKNENIDNIDFAVDYNSKSLVISNGEIAIRRYFMSSLYKCVDNRVIPFIKFNTDNTLPQEQIELMKSDMNTRRQIFRDRDIFKGIDIYLENDSLIYIQYQMHKNCKLLLSKTDNKHLFFSLKDTPERNLWSSFQGIYKNQFYSVVQGEAYSRLLENEEKAKKYSLKIESNPVIMLYRINSKLVLDEE